MQHAMAAGHLPSSLVPNSLPGHGGYSPGQLGGGGGGRSPVASPTPQPPGLTGPGAGGGGSLMPGYGGGLTPGNSSHNTSGIDLIVYTYYKQLSTDIKMYSYKTKTKTVS